MIPDDRPPKQAWIQALKGLWQGINLPLPATIIGGVVVIIVVAVFALDSGSSNESPVSPADRHVSGGDLPEPKDVTEEVEQRPLWSADPKPLKEAEGMISYEGDGYGPYIGNVVAFDGNDVRAYTPYELAQDAVSIQGLPVVLVGRVVSDVSVASDFGIEREIRIVGQQHGYDAYIGTDSLGGFVAGAVVVASGRVAAIGESQSPTRRRLQTVYFASVSEANGGVTEDAELLSPTSPAIATRVRTVKRK